MATKLSQTLTSATTTNTFNPQANSPAGRSRPGPTVKVTGGVATYQLELSDDAGTNWYRFGAPVTLAAGNKVCDMPQIPRGFSLARFNITAYTSGNVVFLVTD